MEPLNSNQAAQTLGTHQHLPATDAAGRHSPAVQRVLRNTYALLSLTLLFSALTASAAVAMKAPAPGLLISLVGSFGLLFLVHKLQNSAWSLPAIFALTGFLGYTIAPQLTAVLSLPGGGHSVAMALAATGASFLTLSAFALVSKRDFSFMGSFLLIGMVIALVAGLAAAFFQIPALALAVAAMVALLSAGLMLMETSRIVNGGETNYVLATVGLYLSIYNMFSALLALFGMGGGSDD